MKDAVTTEIGRVVGWVAARGFGFIEAKGQDRDLFFVATAARSAPGERVDFVIGDRVEFKRGTGWDGRPMATWVRRIEETSDGY